MARVRDHNLDLVRAAAITLVVIYHVAVMWPLDAPVARRFTTLGQYGVDLFFVLSGWLVGGLYWREYRDFGSVDLPRFWFRRALRTMPPYFVALTIVWTAAYISRGQPFSLAYLVFLQNYLHEVPFFNASWSLSVEEHFYLTLPLVALVATRLRWSPVAPFVALVFLPLIAKHIDPGARPHEPFGYAVTATHLRITGIAIGLVLAYLSVTTPGAWTRVQALARRLVLPALALFLSLAWWSDHALYFAGFDIVALIFGCVIAAVAGRPPLPLAASRWVYRIAVSSYSIYLTHGLAIHGGLWIRARTASWPAPMHLLLWVALVALVGFLFYRMVEATSIAFRDRVARPRRTT